MKKHRAFLLALLLASLVSGCGQKPKSSLETQYNELDDSAKMYFDLPLESCEGEHFQSKCEVTKVRYDEGERYYYHYTIYVLPLYDEKLSINYFQFQTNNDEINQYISDTGHMTSPFDLSQKFKGTSGASVFAGSETLDDYRCCFFTFYLHTVNDETMREENITVEQFEEAVKDIQVSVHYDGFKTDTIHVNNIQIADYDDSVPRSDLAELHSSGTCHTYIGPLSQDFWNTVILA